MTQKQVRFAQEFLVDRDAAGAAERAGLSREYGRRLAELPQVQELIRAQTAILSQEQQVRRKQVLEGLCQLAFGKEEAVKVAERIRALELLGKHLGIFEGKGEKLEPVRVVEDV